MRTRLTLKPGRPGTKDLLAEYGDRLLCVRYRYDEERHLRYKTAEVIVDATPWTPAPPFAPTDIIDLRIRPSERLLRAAAHLLGARPAPNTHTWRTTYAVARILHLTARATHPTSTRTNPRIYT